MEKDLADRQAHEQLGYINKIFTALPTTALMPIREATMILGSLALWSTGSRTLEALARMCTGV